MQKVYLYYVHIGNGAYKIVMLREDGRVSYSPETRHVSTVDVLRYWYNLTDASRYMLVNLTGKTSRERLDDERYAEAIRLHRASLEQLAAA